MNRTSQNDNATQESTTGDHFQFQTPPQCTHRLVLVSIGIMKVEVRLHVDHHRLAIVRSVAAEKDEFSRGAVIEFDALAKGHFAEQDIETLGSEVLYMGGWVVGENWEDAENWLKHGGQVGWIL